MPGTNLWIPFQIQLDSSGSGEQEVGAPALGQNWQAFATLNPAPAGQSQTISVSGQVVASGARQSGPFAAGSGQGVTVTIAGGTASSAVAGVLQGAILPGTAAQAPLPGNGNLFEISGGVIDATITGPVDANITNASLSVTGSSVIIESGQTGLNVSTDSPPQPASSNLVVPASSAADSFQVTPPAGATGFVLITVPNSTSNPTFTVSGVTSLNVYAEVTYLVNASGTIVGVIEGNVEPLLFQVSGWDNSGTSPATAAFVSWLFGSGVQQVQNDIYQPLFVRGVQGSSRTAIDTSPEQQSYATVGATITAAGQVVQLLNGQTGLDTTIRRLKLFWNPSTTSEVDLQTSSTPGTGVVAKFGFDSVVHVNEMDFDRVELGAGVGLWLATYTGTGSLLANLVYTMLP